MFCPSATGRGNNNAGAYGCLLHCFKPLFNNTPIQVLEKCVEVLAFASRAIIEKKRMFPHVEREDDGKRREVSLMLLSHESCLEFPALRVEVENGPSWSAHVPDSFHVFDEISVILLLKSFGKRAVFGKLLRTAFELREIQFVQSHAVEFERLAAHQLPESDGMLLGALPCVFGKLRRYRVEILYVSFVKREVLLHRFVGN